MQVKVVFIYLFLLLEAHFSVFPQVQEILLQLGKSKVFLVALQATCN